MSVQVEFMGNVDVAHVCSLFKVALSLFLSRRKSALSTQMFTDLFSRFPVSRNPFLNRSDSRV